MRRVLGADHLKNQQGRQYMRISEMQTKWNLSKPKLSTSFCPEGFSGSYRKHDRLQLVVVALVVIC